MRSSFHRPSATKRARKWHTVALFAIILALLFVGSFAKTEAELRQKLGIPPSAKRVLILSQSSHLDWDWNDTFPGYYNSSVRNIFTRATELLERHRSDAQPYYYSIAETAFLQTFWEENPKMLDSLRKSGQTLRIVGGGACTPDSLLSNGEAFIRNFLVGQTALRNVSLPTMTNMWIPDDFGHDSQLPVMTRAMGLEAAAFARVPGSRNQGPAATRLDKLPSIAQQLMNDGVSFTWKARDGSTMFAHWLQDHYNQGDKIDSGTIGDASNCKTYESDYNAAVTNLKIAEYIHANGPTSVSPYMFVAIGDDFQAPKPCLLTYCKSWNTRIFGTPISEGDVYVVSATFDHYVELVKAFTSNPSNQRPLPSHTFHATPYWTGFYVSRPLLKVLHEASTRKAIAAETLILLSRTQSSLLPVLKGAWDRIAPSTHHDFITGTAPDRVYYPEQIPYLTQADEIAGSVASRALNAIAASLQIPTTNQEKGIVMFNPLGFKTGSVPIILPEHLVPNAKSFFDGEHYQPVQKVSNGYVTMASSLPALSTVVGKLGAAEPTLRDPPPTVRFDPNEHVVIENAYIRVIISRAAGWAAKSIRDLKTGQELIQPSARDAGAFSIETLWDHGNIYRFANEMDSCTMGNTTIKFETEPISATPTNGERGPVRITFPTRVLFFVDNQVIPITRTYVLYKDDRMIRVEVEGSAAPKTSVFMRTPITFQQPLVTYGTPYHYDTHVPPAYWPGYNFMAIHNYFTLTSLNGLNIAFYTSVLRAWALDGTTVVTGLFRNNPKSTCTGYGADGSDPDAHNVSLAFRIPSGLQGAPSLVPLQESLQYSTPILTSSTNKQGERTPDFTYFEPITGNAIITTVKPSETDPRKIVLRVYSPLAGSESPTQVTIKSGVPLLDVVAVTALENSLPASENSVSIDAGTDSSVTFTMRAALITLLATTK